MSLLTNIREVVTEVSRVEGEIEVGIFDDPENAGKLSATEMGTPTALPRPSLSTALVNTEPQIEQIVDRQTDVALSGGVPSLEEIGELVVGETQRVIDAGVPPELKESTLARRKAKERGFLPLDDTGKMREAITFRAGGSDG